MSGECEILLEGSRFKMARWIKEVISSMTVVEKNCFPENKKRKKSFGQLMSHSEPQQRVKTLKNHSEKEIKGL